MATAVYRTPQVTPRLSLEPRCEQSNPPFTVSSLCRDLRELCEMGILEAFRDEYNIVRYRPVQKAA